MVDSLFKSVGHFLGVEGASACFEIDGGFLVVGRFGLHDFEREFHAFDVGILLEFGSFLVDIRGELLGSVEVEGLKLKIHSH